MPLSLMEIHQGYHDPQEGSSPNGYRRNTTMAKTKQQPAHDIWMAAIKATLWENQTTAAIRHNVTVNRIYKDGDEWKQAFRAMSGLPISHRERETTKCDRGRSLRADLCEV
jgi:hypothetical protein